MATHGRLGNQLFQFAALRALLPEGVPVPVYELQASATPLAEALRSGSYRTIAVREALRLRVPPAPPGPSRRVIAGLHRRVTNGRGPAWLAANTWAEPRGGGYDPTFAEAETPVLYVGFFQDESYFGRPRMRWRVRFRPQATTGSSAEAAASAALGRRTTVAVIVRAGPDYERIGWGLPFSWYRQAAQVAASVLGEVGFTVFSDVPLAAEAFASALRDLGPAISLARCSAVDQLHLIAAADHAIVSSSSFAWWGAWLGDHRRGFAAERRVWVPDVWALPGLILPPNGGPDWRSHRVQVGSRRLPG